VENVVRVSDDGSRVYFVARGVLASNLGANGRKAIAGANNLYVWQKDAAHPAGETMFAATLDVNDVGGGGNVETTPDGRYLLVNTTTTLVTSGPTADTDGALDVYRYDAETRVWLRISTDTMGGGGNAEIEAYSRGSTRPNSRPRVSMTSDGSTVVFITAEALSPSDTDGVTDVYEFHDGQVSLISPDGGGEPRITSSGTDIFFATSSQLTAADGDTNPDVYDARVGGGFSFARPQPCSGEACRGALPPAPSAPAASGSATFNGPGSPAPPLTAQLDSKPKPLTKAQKLARALKACKSKHNKKKRSACEKRARATYRRASK
jgi:Tol biopolymer transport system component